MGRKKSDSPISFPWEKLFSESDNDLDQAISYCSSDHMSSDIIKRAVTTVVSGYNSGSKVTLCNKIKDKANHIRQQILKSDNPDESRQAVIEFYKQTFLKKFEGKFEGINNIVVPARPMLPELSVEERKIYGSPPSSPRSKPRVVDIEIEDLELEPTLSDVTDSSVLSANGIIYLSTIQPDDDGKIKKINIKDFYSMLEAKYKGTESAEYILNKENVKKEVVKLTDILKKNNYKAPSKTDSKNILEKASKIDRYGKGEVNVIQFELPPVKVPVKVVESVKQEGITEDEILKYIDSKGWSAPSVKSKEKLCDYVLTKITKEDKKHEKEYNDLTSKVEKLTTDLFALIEMHEERLKKLEIMKKKRKVSFAEKNEIKIIENEAAVIEDQMTEVKDEIEEVKQKQEKIETEKETKRQMCFKMKTWLDQDDFDKIEAEKDLMCGNNNICNVDKSECESSISSSDYSAEVGASVIKGSKDLVDKITKKFQKKKPLVIEEEEIEEEPKKQPLVIEEEEMPDIGGLSLEETVPQQEVVEEEMPDIGGLSLEEDIQLSEEEGEKAEDISLEALKQNIENIVRTSDIDELSSKELRKDLSKIFGGIDFSSRKEEIKRIKNEVLSSIEDEIRSKAKEIVSGLDTVTERDLMNKVSTSVAVLDIEYFRDIIKEFAKQKCNTISLDIEVDEETRAKDLMCGEGQVCNLDISMCVPENEVEEPIEELTIGGMLIKVAGSNNILEKLKQKIMKSGGSIPIVEEPVLEEEVVVEEEPAEDVFESRIPGVRPTLETIIAGIKSISKSTSIVSEQSKIKIANKKCLERIAACAGINI
jgi:hypothetical protein